MEHHDWMQRMEEASQKQTAYARGQFIMTAICALCCVIILVVVLSMVPQLRQVLDLVPQMQEVLDHANASLTNLEEITDELAQVDLAGMVNKLSRLALTTEASIRQTLEKLQQLDFDVLNEAIHDLASVVKPLADFFDRF